MKKILMTLMYCMIFLAVPVTAYAAKDQTDTYEYEIRDGKAVLTRYATSSNATRVVVPDKVDGYEVMGLEGTFRQNHRVNEVIISNGIEFLGGSTFSYCRKLKNVTLPDTLYQIGSYEFEYTTISEIEIPETVETIERWAFINCESLENIDLSRLTLTEIGWGTFDNCKKLEKVIIPDGIISIGASAFDSCESLNSINFPNSIIRIEGSAFCGCSKLKNVKLPDSLQYLGYRSFGECDIEEFIIPKNVKDIESNVAYGINLKRIVNLSSFDYDKTVFDSMGDYKWYTSENGDELAEYLPAKSTIYRRKIDGSGNPQEPDSPTQPEEPDNPGRPNPPDMPDNPNDDKEKIKIQEIELSITCTKPNENINPKYLSVNFKTEHCHVKEINVTRYNRAEIIIVPDDGYKFSNNIQKWSNVSGAGIEIGSISKHYHPDGIEIEVTNSVSSEPSEGDTEQILFDKYIDKIENELDKIKEEQINMADANTVDSVREYVTKKLSKPFSDKIEMNVIVDDNDYGPGEFRPAETGTASDRTGKNGRCYIYVRIWKRGDKETLEEVSGSAIIKATEYASSSGGSSGGSGGGFSSGGGRRSSGGSSSNNASRGLSISKTSIIMGIWEPMDGKWKLKISDGSYASSQWASIDGKWYLLGGDGYMLNSWQMVNDKWYFFGPDGTMLTGWQFIDEKWYWMEESGEMITGWKQIDNKWYYLGANGAMLAGTTTPDGYMVNENGEWIQ